MAAKQKPQKSPAVTPRTQSVQLQIKLDKKALSPLMDLGQAGAIINAIEKKRKGTKLLALVYNEAPPMPCMITPALLAPLSALVSKMGKVKKLDLFLRSTGGVAEVPWRIVTLLREFADELTVIIPSIALSGATHISIAADELVMSPFSVLGSVDPTRNHALLPKDASGKPIPISVEDLKHCIRFVKEQLGESYPQQNLALIISELFKYIDPLALGALEQSYNLSKLITRKCLKSRKAQLGEEQIEKIVDLLAGAYCSHSFLISRSEVENELGLPVTKPDDELIQLMKSLEDYYLERFYNIKQLPDPNSNLGLRVGGVLQLSSDGQAIAQILQPDGKLVADPWLPIN
ncbi:MAG: hypothetical protein JXB43_00165 [Dehalococcoidia bacterium]|nr:hypothetical protein [Dehalococcoidia bacterium]